MNARSEYKRLEKRRRRIGWKGVGKKKSKEKIDTE